MQCFCQRFGLYFFQNMTKVVLEKVVKLLLRLGIDDHGDLSMKLFANHKLCYDSQ